MNKPLLDFVVFSDDFGRHPSSCQHLFNRIARDHRVLWVNTIGLRAPRADAFTFLRGLEKIRQWRRPLRQIHDNLWVLAPVMLPVAGRGHLARLNARFTVAAVRRALKKLDMPRPIFWTTVPTAEEYVGYLNEPVVIYYVTDDYSLWPAGNADVIRQADRRLTERANLILACSESLAAAHRTAGGNTVLLPHAVDFDHFACPRPQPEDLRAIPHPRACFFGLIYEKIDLESLRDLAVREPGLQVILIGPVKTDTTRLAALPNVHILGPRPYDVLPAYLQAMDVIVIPYVPDEEIRASGPLKIRECLALGKPTVARAIPDLTALNDVIHLYHERDQFTAAVRAALAAGSNGRAKEMQDRVKADTWEARVALVYRELARLQP